MNFASVAQSNVDYITEALTESPADHAWEVSEEHYNIELGERPATWLAAFDVQCTNLHDIRACLAYFAVMVVMPWVGRA